VPTRKTREKGLDTVVSLKKKSSRKNKLIQVIHSYVSFDPESDAPPEHPIICHGSRVLLIVFLAVLFRLLFPFATHYQLSDYEVGMVAPEDVVAPFSYSVYKIPSELAREREVRAAGVQPVLEYHPGAYDSVMVKLNRFFLSVDSLSQDSDTLAQSAVEFFTNVGVIVDDQSLANALDQDKLSRIREETSKFFKSHLNKGVLTGEVAERLGDVQVTSDQNGQEILNNISDFFTIEQVYDRALYHDLGIEDGVTKSIFLSLVNRMFKPNVIYNELETARRKEHARNQVSPIQTQVLEGEKIITEGYRITLTSLDKYIALKTELARREKGVTLSQIYLPIIGGILINLFILGIFALYLNFYRKALYASFSKLALFGFTFFIVMGLSSIIARFPEVPVYLVPIAIGSILIAVMFDGRLALVATLVLAILIGGQENFGYQVLFVSFVGGVSATISTRMIRSRGQFYRSILYLATGYVISIMAVGFVRLVPWNETLQSCGWGIINSVFSTFVAMGLLPLMEYLFKVTTDIKLLELSDFNHPLMKELAIRAPGTWAHSLAVSNLAESAADKIGANSLLVRVASYYHDIGKIHQPLYFIENQQAHYNPHDSQSPSMSALIIESHVKKGIEMARKYKLPQCIIDFIPQHHGTSMISFFYDKAKEQSMDDEIDPYQYRYPGPRPESKETAILMLADAIESMSRTIKEPVPQKVGDMIRAIVKSRVDAGQFINSNLTFKDLKDIEEEFIKDILATFHHRIEYPGQLGVEDEKDKNGAREQNDASSSSNADERT